MDYSSLTDTLNGLIQSDTHPWTNIPGGLEKVSESLFKLGEIINNPTKKITKDAVLIITAFSEFK
jgi:hypothetical protein